MGMSQIMNYDQKENKKNNIISYLTDYILGFLLLPLSYVLFFVSVSLIKDPLILSDGLIALYISILIAIYYILSKKTVLKIKINILSIGLFIFGIFSFGLLHNFL